MKDETLSKADRINLGLDILAARSRRGRGHSCAEIAAWCDCSAGYVAAVEQQALRKLKKALRRAQVREI